jgi:Zn-finger nucleic acid-binding protein
MGEDLEYQKLVFSNSKIKCPKCNVIMRLLNVDDVETDECPKCGGIWVDIKEEKQVLEMRPSVFTVEDMYHFRRIYTPTGKMEEVRYFMCPHCREPMLRKNYMSHSGIIIDQCPKHGKFFDKGELEKAIEYVKKGGIKYEKFARHENAIQNTQAKLAHEISRVETSMYKLHWIGRFLSSAGF